MPEIVSRLAHRPVVTGIGPVCFAGVGRAALSKRLAGNWPEEPAPLHDPRTEGIPVAAIPLYRPGGTTVESLLSESRLAGLPEDPELRLAAAAASLAIRDAGVDGKLETAALLLTWEAPGMDRLLRGLYSDLLKLQEAMPSDPRALFEHLYRTHKDASYSSQAFLHLHLLARSFGIHGHTLFVNNACASGLYALDAAASLISAGKADIAVVIGAESPCFPTKYLWFAEGGLHSTDGFLRPFDGNRTGLILGEGAAAVVLEPMARARARGTRIHAEYLGGHFNQEGWKVTIPNFAEPFHEMVLRGACEAAGIPPASVDVIVAHGAGTALSDAYEARGISAVFGQWPERPKITALKGWFGHTLGASAVLELAATLACIPEGFVPGTAGFRCEDPRIKIRPATRSIPFREGILLKASNGFAGFNGAAIFRVLPP